MELHLRTPIGVLRLFRLKLYCFQSASHLEHRREQVHRRIGIEDIFPFVFSLDPRFRFVIPDLVIRYLRFAQLLPVQRYSVSVRFDVQIFHVFVKSACQHFRVDLLPALQYDRSDRPVYRYFPGHYRPFLCPFEIVQSVRCKDIAILISRRRHYVVFRIAYRERYRCFSAVSYARHAVLAPVYGNKTIGYRFCYQRYLHSVFVERYLSVVDPAHVR